MTEADSGSSGPDERYDPSQQDRSVIAMPLLEQMAVAERNGSADAAMPLVIDVNLDHPAGRLEASLEVRQLVDAVLGESSTRESAAGSTRVAETSGQYASATYSFRDRFVHNLLADKYIAGHGDVRNVQVANAVLQAVIATPASPPEG